MSEELKKCAACRTEKPVKEMKVCMHSQMHYYVCDSKCMHDFYNPPKKPAAPTAKEYEAIKAERDRLKAELASLRATHPAPASVGGVEVVAYIACSARMTMDGWENGDEYAVIASEASDAEKRYNAPLMTVAQHNRILAATVPATSRVLPVELLEEICEAERESRDNPMRLFNATEKLRALLEVKP